MVNSISSNNAVAKNQIAAAAPAPVKPPVKLEAAQVRMDVPKADVVELSHSAQAKLLRQQGLSIPQIAIQLRLDVKTVTGFFQ